MLKVTGAPMLEWIDLSNNGLRHINSQLQSISGISSSSNLTIDLSGNPLICDCSAEAYVFLRRVHAQGPKRLKHWRSLQCHDTDEIYLLKEKTYM